MGGQRRRKLSRIPALLCVRCQRQLHAGVMGTLSSCYYLIRSAFFPYASHPTDAQMPREFHCCCALLRPRTKAMAVARKTRRAESMRKKTQSFLPTLPFPTSTNKDEHRLLVGAIIPDVVARLTSPPRKKIYCYTER